MSMIPLFELEAPIETEINVLSLEELEKWASSLDLSTVEIDTPVGKGITFNNSLGLIPDPHATSSEQLRALQKEYKNQGINLYFVYPWEERSYKLLSHFRSKLGLDTRKYAAKRLLCEVIDNKTADRFMNDFHIQGLARGVDKVSIALMTKDTNEVLAVQQFSKYRFGVAKGRKINESKVWEGLRLCFRPGVQIYGGATRLQKYFEKNYNPEKIISYVNASHSLGGEDSYKLLQGFKDITDWKQLSYMWVLEGEPKVVPIIDKNGDRRVNDLDECRKNKYLNPTRMAGAFGKGIGQTVYGGKLGSRVQLREHPENGELVHNDAIMESIGFVKRWTAGQYKWVKEYNREETD